MTSNCGGNLGANPAFMCWANTCCHNSFKMTLKFSHMWSSQGENITLSRYPLHNTSVQSLPHVLIRLTSANGKSNDTTHITFYSQLIQRALVLHQHRTCYSSIRMEMFHHRTKMMAQSFLIFSNPPSGKVGTNHPSKMPP